MECIILAGGLGTRLRSVVDDKPKALALIHNKPFLSFIIENLISNNVNKFIFSLGYLHDQIEDFLKNEYPNLDYKCIIEEKLLGTGGAIVNSLKHCNSNNILVINSDTFLEIDLKSMFKFHIEKKSNLTIALKKMNNFDRYGLVSIDENSRIIDFKEKEFTNEGYINAGYLFLNKNIFKKFNKKVFSFEKEFLFEFINILNMYGYITNGYFIDIGIPEDYEKFKLDHK